MDRADEVARPTLTLPGIGTRPKRLREEPIGSQYSPPKGSIYRGLSENPFQVRRNRRKTGL